jgi:hypothetical protein
MGEEICNMFFAANNAIDTSSTSDFLFAGCQDTFRQATPRTITNSTDAGCIGEICWDATGYIYLCVADNTWQRVLTSTW